MTDGGKATGRRGVTERRGNLPWHPTRFFNRRSELASLSRLILRHRLISLLGPVGAGKTRLAQRIGEEVWNHFPDGVWLVELAAVTEGELVADAAMRTVGLREDRSADSLAVLERGLAARRLLLIVDNCEHVIGHVAPMLARLVQACPEVRILATSRERLGVPGEHICMIEPLAVPSPERSYTADQLAEVDSVALFLDRAGLARAERPMNDSMVADVAELLRRLEGLPLAIELAAAWVPVLSPSELLRRLGDRFRLLVSRDRAANPRHTSLGAAIDASYESLEPDEKLLFRELGLFAGGWNLQSMSAVCRADPLLGLQILSRLVDRSLVTVVGPVAGITRYRLLEALREYAVCQLRAGGEVDAGQRRFSAHFVSLAESVGPRLNGPDGPHWLATLDAELGNLRAALNPEVSPDPELRLRLAVALIPYWHFRGLFQEGRRQLREAVAAAEAPSPVAVAALIGRSRLAWAQGELVRAGRHARQAFRMARRVGDRAGSAQALLRLAQSSFDSGRMARTRSLVEHALAIAAPLEDYRILAAAEFQLGQVALIEGRLEESDYLLWRSVELFHAVQFVDQEAMAWLVRGRLLLRRGDHEAAGEALLHSLAMLRDFQLPRHTVPILESLAALAAAEGNLHRATRLAGAAAGLLERIGARPPATAPMRDRMAAQWRPALTVPGSERQWAEGKAMDLDEAIRCALGESGKGAPEPADDPDRSPLTPRQLEVAGFVAAGLTNRQIADRLSISERTAEGHVEQIRDRLGFSSRTQIATWFVRRARAGGG